MRRFASIIVLGLCVGCGRAASPPAANVGTSPESPSAVVAAAKEQTRTEEQRVRSALEGLDADEQVAAIRRLTQLIQTEPANAAAFSARSTVLFQRGKLDEALADMNRAVELRPQEPRFLNNRALLLLSFQRHDQAITDADRALALQPDYPQAWNHRGLALFSQGKVAEAIVAYDAALSVDPDYVDALNNRGFARLHHRQLEGALADLNRVLTLNPKYVNGYLNRGMLRLAVRDFEGAVADLTEGTLLAPLDARLFDFRRQAYLAMGLTREAQADADHLKQLGWEQQLIQLTSAIEESSQDSLPWLHRAQYLAASDRLDEAEEDVNHALDLDAQGIESLLLRARLRASRRAWDDAAADCSAVLAITENLKAYSIRGECRLAQGMLDEALADFDRAGRFDSLVAEAYLKKSLELAAAGSSEQAAAMKEQAVLLDADIEQKLASESRE